MRATIERVLSAGVAIESSVISSIKRGLCVKVGFHKDDTFEDIEYMAKKILSIGFFPGGGGNSRRTVVQEDLEILCVSEPGNETTFPDAMDEGKSEAFYLEFLAVLRHKYKSEKIRDCGLRDRKEVRVEKDGCAMSGVDTRARYFPSPNGPSRLSSGVIQVRASFHNVD